MSEKLADALQEQLVEDALGLLNWLDEEYDVDVPQEREAAGALVEVMANPTFGINLITQQEISPDVKSAMGNEPIIRYQMARAGLQVWAQQMSAPLVPPRNEPPRGFSQ